MKRIFLTLTLLTLVCAIWADQSGYVRTIKRPNREPQRLSDVMLKAQGEGQNMVKTDAEGNFHLLFPGLKPGQGFALSMIMKNGYELCETELKGRKLAYSEEVPLEILMVSKADLQAEKAAIEAKARENVQKNYEAKMAELMEQYEALKISDEELEAKVAELDNTMTSFDKLLNEMARRYAVTDYTNLTEEDMKINEAIESGNMEDAKRMLDARGTIEDRLKKLEETKALAKQKEEEARRAAEEAARQIAEMNREQKSLEDDLYSYFTYYVEHFQNDSAADRICRRAELDTLNSEYQLQAGQFLMMFMADYDRALSYFKRAHRVAEQQNGPEYGDVATALSEIGEVYKYKGDYATALTYCQQAMTLREKIAGKESKPMAESYTNLAALYFHEKRYDEAIPLMQEALRLYEMLCEEGDPQIANACNNLGSNLLMLRRYADAAPYVKRSYKLFRSCYGENDYHVGIALSNLGSLAYVGKNLEKSEEFFRRSVEILTRVLGPNHPRTKQSQENLDYVVKARTEQQ